MTEAERKAGITPEYTTGTNGTITEVSQVAITPGFTYNGLSIHGGHDGGVVASVTLKDKCHDVEVAAAAYGNLMADLLVFLATVPQVRDALNRHGFRVIDHREKETT